MRRLRVSVFSVAGEIQILSRSLAWVWRGLVAPACTQGSARFWRRPLLLGWGLTRVISCIVATVQSVYPAPCSYLVKIDRSVPPGSLLIQRRQWGRNVGNFGYLCLEFGYTGDDDDDD